MSENCVPVPLMEQNERITFEVMIMSSDILEKAIAEHNQRRGTDFRIIQTVDDALMSCSISASHYTLSELFDLGHRLSVIEHDLRQKGEFDW